METEAKRGVLSTKFKTLVGAAARMSKAMKSVDEERGLYEITREGGKRNALLRLLAFEEAS